MAGIPDRYDNMAKDGHAEIRAWFIHDDDDNNNNINNNNNSSIRI